jgi:hypothetical protein
MNSPSGSTQYEPYGERRRGGDNCHPGRTPFTLRILRTEIPRAMEKPPMLETYDGTTDPDEHLVEHLDIVQDYYQAWRDLIQTTPDQPTHHKNRDHREHEW